MPEPLPELGPNEHLLAAILGLEKPRYVGERWPLLDEGETSDEMRPELRPENFLPVEAFLFAVAGQLHYRGQISRTTSGALGNLLDQEWAVAARIAHGEYLERVSPPPHPTEGWTFPEELMLLDRGRAAEYHALLSRALHTYRDADAEYLRTEFAHVFPLDTDDGLDRKVFADLAQLAAVYDTLLADDVEILYATIW